MPSDQKKVFLSYRRQSSGYEALNVYQHLTHEDYDVFMDVESLDSGRFPDLILHQIEARPHFLVVLVPGSLERTLQTDDWLRQEIEHALRLDRNVVPLMLKNFSFEDEEKRLGGRRLPKTMKELSTRNAIPVYQEYFKDAMNRLTSRFITKERKVVVKPAPAEDVPVIQRMDFNAKAAKLKASGELFWSSRTPLEAPAFKAPVGRVLEWTMVPFATGYVVQKSPVSMFVSPTEVYDGPATSFVAPDSAGRLSEHYRVKAKGGFAFLDSPWSDTVAIEPTVDWKAKYEIFNSSAAGRRPGKVTPTFTSALDAPVLEWTGTGCRWTPVPGAHNYVLEMSADRMFSKPVRIFKGAKTELSGIAIAAANLQLLNLPARLPRYYRVKATSPLADESEWSNVVEER
jgi:hypothetical protein